MDNEDPEAWANYYLGRAGANYNGGLVSEAEHQLLEKALEKATGPLLGYHVAYTLDINSRLKLEMVERMRTCALGTCNLELIIMSMLELYKVLIHNQKIEQAYKVHSELMELVTSSSDGPASQLGKGVIEFMEGMRLEGCRDYDSAEKSFRSAIGILEPLWQSQGRGSLGSYLGTRNECLSNQSKLCLEVILSYQDTIKAPEGGVSVPAAAIGMLKQMLGNLDTRIETLVMRNEDLEQADEEARSLLEELESDIYSIFPQHVNSCFRWSLLISRAEFAEKIFHIRGAEEEHREAAVNEVAEHMRKAMDAARCSLNSRSMLLSSATTHGHLLSSLGRNSLAIEKLETSLRSFMALDPDLGEVSTARISYVDGVKNSFRLLQKCLYEAGEFRRALIWSERQHTRDFVHKGKLRDEAAWFDSDDDGAWGKIRSISEECGSDTVILVMNHLVDMAFSDGSCHLFSYLLHIGEIVGHSLASTKLIPVTDLLDLIYTSRDEEKRHEELKRFHSALIAPLERELQEIQPRRIIFAPSQDLALVPYSALMDEDDTFLIQKYSISIVPSLRLLQHCTGRLNELVAGESGEIGLVVGNPKTPGFIDLPDAMEEAREVSESLHEAGFAAVRQLQRSEPTKDVVLSLLPDCSWIHLACHCDLSDEFPEGALILAASPQQEHDNCESYSLTGQEIAEECRLRAFAAILRACRSGMGKKVHSSEGILALPRSFHSAGVPSVVMSLWEVDDEATQQLMKRLYSGLVAGKDLGDALQGAIVETILDNYFGTAEIRDWAAFIISGSPLTHLNLKS